MTNYSFSKFNRDVERAVKILQKKETTYDSIFGVPQGGSLFAYALTKQLNLPLIQKHSNILGSGVYNNTLVVDDIIDSGKTRKKYREFDFLSLVSKQKNLDPSTITIRTTDKNDWIIFWWEGNKSNSITDSILRQFQFLEEDPNREGLLETPARVVKSWKKLYGGYKENPRSVLKVFKDDTCDEMVLLKNIEMYSTCEHHLLPFFGKAHIAYIPNGKVIGISKLARLLEVYSRRMQIQERIGQQVTQALDRLLNPLGSACVIEAQHFCMMSRGIEKQNSIMSTSSLTGVFKKKPAVRSEFMSLVKE